MTGIALHQFDEVGVSEKIFDSMARVTGSSGWPGERSTSWTMGGTPSESRVPTSELSSEARGAGCRILYALAICARIAAAGAFALQQTAARGSEQ
jgi:hypothetical protein